MYVIILTQLLWFSWFTQSEWPLNEHTVKPKIFVCRVFRKFHDYSKFSVQWALLYYYTVSQKNKKNYFCYNYVKLPPNPTIFGTKMANCLKLYEVHSFSTSPNLCHCTTVLIADVPNLSHNAVGLIVSVRLLTIASSIRHKAPHDLIIL